MCVRACVCVCVCVCRHVGPEERYVCRDASDCYSQARCDGQGPLCPASTLRPDGTPCHSGVRACSQGRCRQSMCVMAGLDDCFCAEGVEDRCKLCCRHPVSYTHLTLPTNRLV